MGKKEETQKMRKANMKVFPNYKKIAWDYLFYYTIDFLFLTQIKHISPADVVLVSSIGALFSVLLQIPANIIIEFLGRKNSIILGNVLNCLYLVMFMMCNNFIGLIMAKFVSSLAFALKDIAEPSLLNESIPPSKYKSDIFSKINAKGAAGYYILGAISKIIAGFLFEINGYLPMICSLGILIIVTLLSLTFIEPIKKEKKSFDYIIGKQQIKDIQEGFKFIIKSERLKALIIATSLIASLLTILLNYQTNLLQYLNLSAAAIGMIAAIFSIASAYASKKEKWFQKMFKNKSIMVIALTISITTMIAGIVAIEAQTIRWLAIIVLICLALTKFAHGMFYTIIDKYFRNFSNEKIDTKIFAVKNLFKNVVVAFMGFIASFLLDKMSIAYCMIIVGIAFSIIFVLMGKYMKTRVGKKPEEYSREERRYDELIK
ncbi:MAG: MFS transporter [Clostridia bacterium]